MTAPDDTDWERVDDFSGRILGGLQLNLSGYGNDWWSIEVVTPLDFCFECNLGRTCETTEIQAKWLAEEAVKSLTERRTF